MLTAVPMIVAALTSKGEPSLRQKPCSAVDSPDEIWCGEFGTIRHCKIEWRENWMRDVVDVLNENAISYCAWNYLSTPNDGNRFSLVDDDERKILSGVFEDIIGGKK